MPAGWTAAAPTTFTPTEDVQRAGFTPSRPLVLGFVAAMNVRALSDAPIEGDAAPRLAVGIPMADDAGARLAVCLVF